MNHFHPIPDPLSTPFTGNALGNTRSASSEFFEMAKKAFDENDAGTACDYMELADSCTPKGPLEDIDMTEWHLFVEKLAATGLKPELRPRG